MRLWARLTALIFRWTWVWILDEERDVWLRRVRFSPFDDENTAYVKWKPAYRRCYVIRANGQQGADYIKRWKHYCGPVPFPQKVAEGL